MAKGKLEEWDVTLLSKLLLDDPGLLKNDEEAYSATSKIRSPAPPATGVVGFMIISVLKCELMCADPPCPPRGLRNTVVHEFGVGLSRTRFDELWGSLMAPLTILATFSGPEMQ